MTRPATQPPAPSTGAEAATYQATRAHLAYLRLTAAAESPPRPPRRRQDRRLKPSVAALVVPVSK